MSINVTIFNEGRHEKESDFMKDVYPEGIHSAIKSQLEKDPDINIRIAMLDDPECGLSEKQIEWTDVLIWWGHMAHHELPDEIAIRVQNAVLKGMGFIPLHSSHYSKPFKMLMGTSCSLRCRDDDMERIWVADPTHPIAAGLPDYFELPMEEMYGEFFDIPKPDDIVFLGWFKGGEVVRSGVTYSRGYGKVFYFQPGHEAYPIYYNEHIGKILRNAVVWAAKTKTRDSLECIFPGTTLG